MNYLIREMTIDDINDVILGEEKAFGESLGYDMLYSELSLNPYAYYFILEIDEEVKGYIGTWIEQDRAEIVNFYVDEDYQGLGFGSMMLDFFVALCEETNVPNISLEVRESNIKAQKLYEKFGFEFSHRRVQYYKNSEDALVLIKKMR